MRDNDVVRKSGGVGRVYIGAIFGNNIELDIGWTIGIVEGVCKGKITAVCKIPAYIILNEISVFVCGGIDFG